MEDENYKNEIFGKSLVFIKRKFFDIINHVNERELEKPNVVIPIFDEYPRFNSFANASKVIINHKIEKKHRFKFRTSRIYRN